MKIFRPYRNSRRASTLIMTVMLLIALVAFATIFLAKVIVTSTNASAQISKARAFYLAEGNMQKAMLALKNNWNATSGSSYTIEVVDANTRKITATATDNGVSKTIVQNVSNSTTWVVAVPGTWQEQ